MRAAGAIPGTQGSYLAPGSYPVGARVGFAGSGDTYQVQDDGSVRSTNGGRAAKRARREARRARRRAMARGQPET